MPKIYQYETYVWKKNLHISYSGAEAWGVHPFEQLELKMAGHILTAKQLAEVVAPNYPPSSHILFARRIGGTSAAVGYKFYGTDSSTAYQIYYDLILEKDPDKKAKEVISKVVAPQPSISHKKGGTFGISHKSKTSHKSYSGGTYNYVPSSPKPTYSSSAASYFDLPTSSYTSEGEFLVCSLGCLSFPARSQKIKGMRFLDEKVRRNTRTDNIYNAMVASSYEGEIEKGVTHVHSGASQRVSRATLIGKMQGKFVRPAPESPVHGFVDSRVISSHQEGEKILDEIKETGEVPELIIMDKVSCLYSAVVAPDRIAFGKGNDGATQGDDAVAICLNLGPENEEGLRKAFWSDKKWPYAELLYDGQDSNPLIVQMRAGPKMGGGEIKTIQVFSVTYVSEFKKTTTAAMELIDWKKWVEGLLEEKKGISQDKEGVEITPVVYHEGGELSSHFGVHCNEKGIPYFTSAPPPKVMDIIEVGKKNKPNLEALREGLAIGLDADLTGGLPPSLTTSLVVKQVPAIMADLKNFLAALHLYPYCDLGDPFTAKFIGFSWAIGARLIAGLPLGEARHKTQAAADINNILIKKALIKNPTLEEAKVEKVVTQTSRDLVYAKAWKLDLEVLTSCLIAAKESFFNKSHHWGSSYGGKKWGKCTISLLRVFMDIKNFLNLPTSLNLGNLVDDINTMINEVHNGGGFSWIDKLSTKQVFDDVGKIPHFFLSPARAYEAKKVVLQKFDSKMRSQGKFLALKEVRKEVLEGGEIETPSTTYPSVTPIPVPELSYPYKPTPSLLVEENPFHNLEEQQDEMKKKLLFLKPLLTIGGRFKLMGSHLHVQIVCKPINRAYGMATEMTGMGSYATSIAQLGEANGKKITSLASSSLYTEITIEVFAGDLTIVRFSDSKGLVLQVETSGEFSGNIEKLKA